MNDQKDTNEVEEKKKVLESWQLDQISKHMKEQKQSTTSSTNNDIKSKEMGDNTDEEEGEECSIITEECSIDTYEEDEKKTEGIEYQQQQVVAMEESWFCC